jgi:hypothetical protein
MTTRVSVKTQTGTNGTKTTEFTIEGEPNYTFSREARYWTAMDDFFEQRLPKKRQRKGFFEWLFGWLKW